MLACLFVLITATGASHAQEADLSAPIAALAEGSLRDREARVQALLATGDDRVIPILNALAEGDLYVRKADKQVFIADRDGRTYTTTHPITGEITTDVPRRSMKKIRVNNSLRRSVRDGLSLFTLNAKDPAKRLFAAETIFKSKDPDALPLIDDRLGKEDVPEIVSLLEQAKAAIVLTSEDIAPEAKLDAISILRDRGGRGSLTLLNNVKAEPGSEVENAAARAITSVERRIAIWDALQNVWYGMSLGSVLLLAAIGLAITFGVMGVINMAHGEMVMIGAYTTYVVQQVFLMTAPGLADFSLLVALPFAFLVAGLIGFVLERSVIQFLYGRPLETLLATWGVSLILQQTVRTIFGPTNMEVVNPSWMSGAVELAGLSLTWNRIWIFFFSLAVFGLLFLLLKRTPMGLQMRAVTQNRKMASSMGIRTPWVDAFTFALGSGIAGIAGVALSQIGNVSPNLGQGYIIDSFMVVVFGGVGNLWGTLIGALTLGVANKFLEPFAGAVLGKILVLVFIILFIQKRPRGLFALKGRAVE
ncbi:amino acid/amide ABC transporter membrane protein 1, HAAT family (TC 3.A.1.4.-) [Cohaesibacter sp. ES.047]|nr:amino acid/amide ABC transporter membrane protein 1, HAAT family (TC 3.A.1.4.-) [Cohaesibacter sp. ES.047]